MGQLATRGVQTHWAACHDGKDGEGIGRVNPGGFGMLLGAILMAQARGLSPKSTSPAATQCIIGEVMTTLEIAGE